MNTALEHIAAIKTDLGKEIEEKYMAGQKEHGGKLWRKQVLPFAWEEVLDLPVYLHVLKQQHEEMKNICLKGMGGDIYEDDALMMIYNILTIGNAEGVQEEGD